MKYFGLVIVNCVEVLGLGLGRVKVKVSVDLRYFLGFNIKKNVFLNKKYKGLSKFQYIL